MLRLILGTDWIENREAVLRLIADEVKIGHPGQILMVPELISHDTERRLCAAAGDTASRYAEVLSFTRLLRRVAEGEQLAIPECLDNGGRLIAMASAARMLASKLKSYASVETRPEFLEGLLDAVDEFKRCCITPDLQLSSEQTTGTLAQKLSELSLILEAYDSVCVQGKHDPRDQMNWLLEQLETCDFAREHRFYIDGFPDLTRQHMAILAHMIQNSPVVTVSLTCDRVRSNRAAFEKAGQTAADLIRIAQETGVPYEMRYVKERQDGMEQLRDKLFQGQITPAPALEQRLKLVRCDSVFDECQVAAERIRELVMAGCRYRDFSVVLANPDSYRGILSLVFRRCGVPVYLSGTEDILEKTAVATVLTALDAAMEGLDQKTVLRYLKSVLSPITPEECDELENYAVLWGIRGEKWSREWTLHPAGLGGEWDEESTAKLAMLNDARSRGITPLVNLKKGLREAKTLQNQVDALYAFLDEIHLADGLETLAIQAEQRGDNRSAQEFNQLWEILLSAMEQLRAVLGTVGWDPEAFSRLFRLLLSQYDVGTIPPVLDAVTAGSVSAMRCQQVKHLLVLGAEEGNLPSYAGSAGILTDQERTELRRLGVPLTGGAMEGVAAEFAEIYGCFCGATESVTVSCGSEQPSFLFRRLEEMAGRSRAYDLALEFAPADPMEAGAWLAGWNASETARRLNALEGYRDTLEKSRYGLGTIRREQITALYGKTLNLSASQIDRQAECRLSYFLKYGMRAKERKEITVDPAEFGTYVHAVLENTARCIRDMGGFGVVSLEETLEIAHRYSEEYARERFGQLASERMTYLFRRNVLELDMVVEELWKELRESAFAPKEFEVNFGSEEGLPPIAIANKEMNALLRGFVDRVDTWFNGATTYYRIVDYKTGSKDFDYCDVFNGVGLQMLLYLFALKHSGEDLLGSRPIPAGVQYFPARAPYLTADGKLTPEEAEKQRQSQWKRQGLLLRDEVVLQAMEPGEEPRRMNYKVKKDGTLVGDLADREQLKQLEAYVFRYLAGMVEDIASGNVEPNPYTRGSSHSACDYCPYGAICHKNTVPGRRNYKTMSAERFWEEVGKELSRHGG